MTEREKEAVIKMKELSLALDKVDDDNREFCITWCISRLFEMYPECQPKIILKESKILMANRPKLYPVTDLMYKLSIEDFLYIVNDARTHGMSVIMADGKLFYYYDNESEDK